MGRTPLVRDEFASKHEPLVVTGTGLILPFRENVNFFEHDSVIHRVLHGENFIRLIPDSLLNEILEKKPYQMIRDGDGKKRRFVQSKEDAMKLYSAFSFSIRDLAKQYNLPQVFLEVMDSVNLLGLLVGLVAMNNAKLLSHDFTSFNDIPILKEEYQDRTGIIFASAFPAIESLIDEVSRYSRFQTVRDILGILEQELHDRNGEEQLITSLETLRDKAQSMMLNGSTGYEFDRKFLFKILVFANAQLAQLIKARGPNTQVNSACSSMTQAISIASDWIHNDRCDRVIVISADNVTSELLFPWIGTGFLALGAPSIKGRLEEAAIPFDKRRNGLILGAGAAALVLERDEAVTGDRRKFIRARLVSSHIANSAFHGTALDNEHIAREFTSFISLIERKYGIPRGEIARNGVYVSHETFTSVRGGVAKAEIDGLRSAFKEDANHIVITNIKGYTGHPMGVGFEDVLAVEILRQGIAPAIPNYRVPDPALGSLRFSDRKHHEFEYALHFAAGFGSQLAFTLFQKYAIN